MVRMDVPPAVGDRPTFPPELHDIRGQLDRLFTSTPTYQTLGIKLRDWGPGWAQTTMIVPDSLVNLAGTVHGGMTFTLADAAFEIACNSYGRLAVALETTCHYHRPAPVGIPLVADAWELSKGRRTASYRLRVTAQDDQIVASYLALAYRTSTWHVDADRIPDGW